MSHVTVLQDRICRAGRKMKVTAAVKPCSLEAQIAQDPCLLHRIETEMNTLAPVAQVPGGFFKLVAHGTAEEYKGDNDNGPCFKTVAVEEIIGVLSTNGILALGGKALDAHAWRHMEATCDDNYWSHWVLEAIK